MPASRLGPWGPWLSVMATANNASDAQQAQRCLRPLAIILFCAFFVSNNQLTCASNNQLTGLLALRFLLSFSRSTSLGIPTHSSMQPCPQRRLESWGKLSCNFCWGKNGYLLFRSFPMDIYIIYITATVIVRGVISSNMHSIDNGQTVLKKMLYISKVYEMSYEVNDTNAHVINLINTILNELNTKLISYSSQ